MKTLYNTNFFQTKSIGSDSSFVFVFFVLIVIFLKVQNYISSGLLVVSLLLWWGFILYVRKNWESFVNLFKIFTLRKENLYSKEMLFYYIENINTKYFPDKQKQENKKGKENHINLDQNGKTKVVKNT